MSTDVTFTIRAATEEDVPALHRLIERSVRVLQKNDYTPEQIEGALGHTLGLDTQLVRDRTYFIAEPVGQPGVFAASGGWSYRRTLFGSDHGPGREPEKLDPQTEAAKIRAIFVDPDWSRRGLGTLILKHCEDAAAAAGFTKVEMGSTLTGIPLYTLRGYEARERTDVPLPNGAALPIVKMVKNL